MVSGPNKSDQTPIPGAGFRSRLGWRAPAAAILFLIIPILFLIAVAQLTKAKGPQWLPYSFENPYIYLFNSLLLVQGKAPYYTDHPGTTTELFGAIILRTSSLKSTDDLVASVIQYPEKYIRRLHWALLIFVALVLWILPWVTAVALRNYMVGFLIQAPCIFYKWLLLYGILFGSDLMLVPFSVAAVCCCTLLISPPTFPQKLQIIFGIDNESITPASIGLIRVPFLASLTGLVCALGIVTKLNFFPLIIISLFCCRTKRNVGAFFVAFVLGAAFALLPIYSQLPRLAIWTLNLGIHSGQYDTGAVGFPQTSAYLSSLSSSLRDEPLTAVIPVVTTIAALLLGFSRKKQKPTNAFSWQTALTLVAIQMVSFLVISKETGIHYLIPLALTSGLSLVLFFYVFQTTNHLQMKRAAGWVVLTLLLALGFESFIERTPKTFAWLIEQKIGQLRLYRHAKEVTKNDVRVDYFFSDSPEFPLCYANGYAGRAFGPLLDGMYPKALFLDVFTGKFETFTKSIEPEAILQKYDHLYFLGDRNWFPKVDGLDPATFETIDHAGDYYLQKWTRK